MNNPTARLSLNDFARLIRIDTYIPSNRYSQLLIKQLQDRLNSKPELNPRSVLAAIEELETGKPCGTKPAKLLKGSLLGGLWHKHYEESGLQSVYINIENAIRYGLPSDIPDILASSDSDWEQSRKIAESITSAGTTKRKKNQKYTGEWLVYAQYNNENYYLCLAKHNDGDSNILRLIQEHCMEEFTFLKETLKSTS